MNVDYGFWLIIIGGMICPLICAFAMLYAKDTNGENHPMFLRILAGIIAVIAFIPVLLLALISILLLLNMGGLVSNIFHFYL